MSDCRFRKFIQDMLARFRHMWQSSAKPTIMHGMHNNSDASSPENSHTPFEQFDSCDFLEKNYIQILKSPQLHFLWSLICKVPPSELPACCKEDKDTLARYFSDSLWKKQMRRLISLENDGRMDEIWEFEIDWRMIRAMLSCFSIELDECTTIPLPLLMIQRFVATDYHIEGGCGVMTHRTVNNELATMLTLFPFRDFSSNEITALWTNAYNNVFNVGDNYTKAMRAAVISDRTVHVDNLMIQIVNTAQNSVKDLDSQETDAVFRANGLLSAYVDNYPVFVLLTPPKRNEVQTVCYRILLRRYQRETNTDKNILEDDYNTKTQQFSVCVWLHYNWIRFLKATGMQQICYKMPWLRHSAFLETQLPHGCRGVLVHYEHVDDSTLSKTIQTRYAPISSNGRTIFASLRLDPDVFANTAGGTFDEQLTDPKFTEAAHDQIELRLWMMPAFRILLTFWGFFLFQIAFLISFWNLSIPESSDIDTFRAIAVPLLGTTLIFAAINEHHALTELLKVDRVVCGIMFGLDMVLFLQKTQDAMCRKDYPYSGMKLLPPVVDAAQSIPILQVFTILATWICIALLAVLFVRLFTRTLMRFLFWGKTTEEYLSAKLQCFLFESASCVAVFVALLSVSILLFYPYQDSSSRCALFIAAFFILTIASILSCINMRINQRSRYSTAHLRQGEESILLWQDETITVTDTTALQRAATIARGTFTLLALVTSLVLLAIIVSNLLF